MVLSKRERFIGIATVGAIALLALDHFLLSPLLGRRAVAIERTQEAQIKLEKGKRTFANSRRANRLWSDVGGTKLTHDASAAESQVLHSVRDWAQDAGMSLVSVKPERTDKEGGFQKITLQATGAGGMDQIGRFLWRIQTAQIPVRILDVQLASRKENTDDLTMQLKVSTIYLPPESERKEGKP